MLLIVDDDALIRKAMRRILQRQHEVLEAGNGQEALTLLLNDPRITRVITDGQMPVMSGPELLDQILERGIDVRIAIISSDDRCLKRFSEQGLPAIMKPISHDALIDLAQSL